MEVEESAISVKAHHKHRIEAYCFQTRDGAMDWKPKSLWQPSSWLLQACLSTFSFQTRSRFKIGEFRSRFVSWLASSPILLISLSLFWLSSPFLFCASGPRKCCKMVEGERACSWQSEKEREAPCWWWKETWCLLWLHVTTHIRRVCLSPKSWIKIDFHPLLIIVQNCWRGILRDNFNRRSSFQENDHVSLGVSLVGLCFVAQWSLLGMNFLVFLVQGTSSVASHLGSLQNRKVRSMGSQSWRRWLRTPCSSRILGWKDAAPMLLQYGWNALRGMWMWSGFSWDSISSCWCFGLQLIPEKLWILKANKMYLTCQQHPGRRAWPGACWVLMIE